MRAAHQKRAALLLLSGVCLLLSSALVQAADGAAAVSNEQELKAAFSDGTVTQIQLTANFQLHQNFWSAKREEHVVVLARNVTVFSSPEYYWQIDFNYIQQVLHINAGNMLHFRHVILLNTRYGLSFDLDFIDYSPGGLVFLEDSMKRQSTCVMFNYAVITGYKVPSGFGLPSNYNLNVSIENPFCLPGAPNTCWNNQVLWYHVYAIENPTSAVETMISAGAYVVFKRNSYKACDEFLPQSCVDTLGADLCVKSAINKMLAAADGTNTKKKGNVGVIAGPAAAGGVVLLALIVGLLIWHRRRISAHSNDASSTTSAAKRSLDDKLATYLDRMEEGEAGPKRADSFDAFDSRENLWNSKIGGLTGQGSCNPETTESNQPPAAQEFPVVFEGATREGLTYFLEVLGMPVGKGSFGTVYRGFWNSVVVAVKVLAHTRQSTVKVENEVNLMMSFQHPNVVKAIHYITRSKAKEAEHSSQGSNLSSSNAVGANTAMVNEVETWIVQEYCEGGALCSLVAQQGFMREGKPYFPFILRRLLDIARGMEYLHAKNICHGDLKTANVLIATDISDPQSMVAKVADFGLSRALADGQTHHSTRTVGTVTHMPPELLRKGKLMPAGDVYAFGMMMWELVTATMPFKGLLFGQVVERVVVSGQRPLFPPGFPIAFSQLASECWAARPQDRPSFAAVTARLEAMLGQVDELQVQADRVMFEAAPELAEDDSDVENESGDESEQYGGSNKANVAAAAVERQS